VKKRDPVITLLGLNEMTLKLNAMQTLVDYGRTLAQNDQLFQLALDRKQTEIDEKRALIAYTMADIRNRN